MLYIIDSLSIIWSWRWDSNPRPADYKLASLCFYIPLYCFNKHYLSFQFNLLCYNKSEGLRMAFKQSAYYMLINF